MSRWVGGVSRWGGGVGGGGGYVRGRRAGGGAGGRAGRWVGAAAGSAGAAAVAGSPAPAAWHGIPQGCTPLPSPCSACAPGPRGCPSPTQTAVGGVREVRGVMAPCLRACNRPPDLPGSRPSPAAAAASGRGLLRLQGQPAPAPRALACWSQPAPRLPHLPDAQAAAGAQHDGPQRLGARARQRELQHRDVRGRVAADDARGRGGLVGQRDLDL